MRLHEFMDRLARRLRLPFEAGATSTEYAIMAAFIGAVIFLTVADLAGTLDDVFMDANGMIAP